MTSKLRNSKLAALTFVIAAALSLGAFTCSSSQEHDARRAAAALADSLKGMEQENENIYNAGLISAPETVTIAESIGVATTANDSFVRCLQSIKLAANTRSLIVGCVHQVEAAIAQLDPAQLGLKNPDARARFNVVFQTVQAALATLEAVIGYAPSKPSAAIRNDAVPAGNSGISSSASTTPSWMKVCTGEDETRTCRFVEVPQELRDQMEVDAADLAARLRGDPPAKLKKIDFVALPGRTGRHSASREDRLAEGELRSERFHARAQQEGEAAERCGALQLKRSDPDFRFGLSLTDSTKSWDGERGPGPEILASSMGGLSGADWTQIIALAIQAFGLAAPLVARIKAQSGMSDAELETEALTADEQTRQHIAAHLAHVKQVEAEKSAGSQPAP